jgi:hypothetical protein
MTYRRALWAVDAVAVAMIVPAQAHAQPPTQ